MRIQISNWLAKTLVEKGIDHTFLVPGGGAMYMDVAVGHQEGMHAIFMQHEQSAAIAAEGYVRMYGKLPLVLLTTGPGGTNALTGVLGAWLDSIPMLVISGQVRYATTARAAGVPVRAMGDQEYDITPCAKHMCKYAEMVTDPKYMQYHLEKALYLATHGRPGPVWLDVPLDVQSAFIDTESFVPFDPSECSEELPPAVEEQVISEVIEKVRAACRPVFNAGEGIRIGNAVKEFEEAVRLLNMPVVTGWDSIDLIPDEDPLYVGRAGIMGDRPGNFAIQNSDLVLSVGSRLGVRQVGYDKKTWAREAFVIMVDIDRAELDKPSIHVEYKVQADAKEFLTKLNEALRDHPVRPNEDWNALCDSWKKDYPVVQKHHYADVSPANVYCFIKELSRRLPEGQTTVTGNGSACVVGSHAYVIKKDQRFLINSGAASMGYDLPAAIGACFADDRKTVICLSGDGSIQMNLQELQTIVFHKLPIKIFVINNEGYHSMRQTQNNLFPEFTTVGVGPESRDIGFPKIEKIAAAYDIPYYAVRSNAEMGRMMDFCLQQEGFLICEVFVDTKQKFEPKSATKKLPDGRLVSPPLEDLAPFLPREELKQIMQIPLIPEGED